MIYSIYRIFSPKLSYKYWILTSEKSFTRCPNWGGGNLDKIQKKAVFLKRMSLNCVCSGATSISGTSRVFFFKNICWKHYILIEQKHRSLYFASNCLSNFCICECSVWQMSEDINLSQTDFVVQGVEKVTLSGLPEPHHVTMNTCLNSVKMVRDQVSW